MKPLRIFFGVPDCGCSGGSGSSSSGQAGDSTPVLPGAATTYICDNRYFTLPGAPSGKFLIVPAGSNCQHYLAPATPGARGFVFMGQDGQVYIDPDPEITLPLINPAVSGAVPNLGTFKHLIVGGAGNPSAWQMFTAPTTGTLILYVEGGQFLLKDAGQIPGLNSIGQSSVHIAKGPILTLEEVTPGSYVGRKLAVVAKRVVVGDTATTPGYKSLPDADYLEHPKAKFVDEVQTKKLTILNPSTGVPETGGMGPVPAGVTDGIPVVFSPSTGQYYRAPAGIRQNVTITTDQTVADNGTFVSMGSHCQFGSLAINYGRIFIAACIRLGNDAGNFNAIDFGLFIDNALVHTWDVRGAKDNTLTWTGNVAVGNRNIDIRFRQTAAAGVTTVLWSGSDLFTLP